MKSRDPMTSRNQFSGRAEKNPNADEDRAALLGPELIIVDAAGPDHRGTLQCAGSGRNQYLDLLRAVAILLVLGMHFNHFALLNRIGGTGVDLFFVLSGYLISGLLFREYSHLGSIRIGRFLLRRGLRIWPALYVYVAVMLIPIAYNHQWTFVPPVALFYANYLSVGAGVLGHTWSLAVEEHFYIVLPLVLAWMMRRNLLNYLPMLYVVAAIGCAVARHFQPAFAGRATHCRLDSLLLGVLFCYWHEFRPQIFARLRNLPVALLLILAAWTFQLGPLTLAWGFALLLAWGVDHRMNIPLLPRIGVFSYSIYLWQQPFAVYAQGRHVGLAQFCVLLILAIGFGAGMAQFVEIPVLRLRDKLLKDQGPRQSAAPVTLALASGQ